MRGKKIQDIKKEMSSPPSKEEEPGRETEVKDIEHFKRKMWSQSAML